eukprot:2732864-Heterocapsa_arctica.AAC.1
MPADDNIFASMPSMTRTRRSWRSTPCTARTTLRWVHRLRRRWRASAACCRAARHDFLNISDDGAARTLLGDRYDYGGHACS